LGDLMQVPIDYLLVRAAGISSQLFDEIDYTKLIDVHGYIDFIDQLQHSAYQQVLAREYTRADPIISLIRAVNRLGEKRWNLVTKYAQGELLQSIIKLKHLTDLKNLLLIIDQLPQEEDMEFSPLPGGTVSLTTWKELRTSTNLHQLLGKLLLLAPELYEQNKRLLDSKLSIAERNIEIFKVVTAIHRDHNSAERAKKSPLTYFFLDFINKLVLRVSLRSSIFNQAQIKTLLHYFHYWDDLPDFLGKDFEISTLSTWYQQCIEQLTNEHQGVDQQFDHIYLEDEISRLTLRLLKWYWRHSQERIIHYYITIFQIQLETQNLCWIGYGLYQNLANNEIRRRIIT